MNNTTPLADTPRNNTRACMLLIVALLATFFGGATSAKADTPLLIDTSSQLVTRIADDLRASKLDQDLFVKPVSQPKPTVFVSAELVERVSGLINDGLQIAGNEKKGRLFVHVESHGFGGVVSLRVRR
ncbi:MAG: hypothetical protein AAF436_09525 [Myxococcota bacterium]